MMYVPEGYFVMGSNNGIAGEGPEHQVWLDAYWIYRTEVTNSMYELCVADGSCAPPVDISSPGRVDYYGNPLYSEYPVANLTWTDASNFCEWAKNRLPTEAEWEKAARGTDKRIYPWGDVLISMNLNYNNSSGVTSKVGSFPSGESPYKLLDMAGNVWEWVNDWYDKRYYDELSQRNPAGPSRGDGLVIRGGGLGSSMESVRTYHRANQDAAQAGPGVRCVHSEE